MNTINFNQNDLAITASLLGLLQNSVQVLERLSALGGSRFILTGCEEQGGNVSSGWVVIDGVVMEVPTGGSATGTVYVKTTTTGVNVQDGSYSKTVHQLIFGSGADNFSWSEVKRLDSLQTLLGRINDAENAISGKEPSIDKNSGFNHSKSDSVSTDSSSYLATSKAVKIAYDKGASALTAAGVAQTDAQTAHDLAATKAPSVHSHSQYGTMYTSFAQLGLTDTDFSLSDWEANARLVFDRMAPKSTFKAALCGAGEMPKLNASIIASGCPFVVGGNVSPALEFNREDTTSSPCVVFAKNNNSPRYAYYNIDNAGSEWVEMAAKPKVGNLASVIMGSAALTDDGSSSFSKTISIGAIMPNTNYKVLIQPTSPLEVRDYWIKVSSKTTTSFTITVKIREGESQSMDLDWVLIMTY